MDELGTLTMSTKELNRLEILGRVLERRLTQAEAAEQLGLGVRQVERLCRRLRLKGRQGLISKKRGRPSNRKLPAALRERALELVQSRYADFGSNAGRGEARRAARRGRLGRDAATLDDRSRDLGPPLAAEPSRSSAPTSPILLR
ncbi:MAG TPA: helix-turn-helix domain-containing protein [Myxococcales bacterium]|nr:helix-turn-helix domain-containing protein [Myxococcales bacterium]